MISTTYKYSNGKRFLKVNGDWVEAPYTDEEAKLGKKRLAELCAARQFPAIGGTDHNFLQGRDNNQEFNRMQPKLRKFYAGRAKKAGVNIRGKVYLSGLAKEPGDPSAWVSDLHEAEAKTKSNGWTRVKD